MSGSERVDFSGNAPVYDRRHGAFAPEGVVTELMEVTGLPRGSRILDVGAGTGRAAIPFARRGCSVVAMDAAPAMLVTLVEKIGVEKIGVEKIGLEKKAEARVAAVVGDVMGPSFHLRHAASTQP